VHLPHVFWHDPQLLARVRQEVRDEDVGTLDELVEHRAALVDAQIERDAALVAVRHLPQEVEVAGVGRQSLLHHVAQWVALRRLDLDHVRAPVGERGPARRHEPVDRELDDLDPVQYIDHLFPLEGVLAAPQYCAGGDVGVLRDSSPMSVHPGPDPRAPVLEARGLVKEYKRVRAVDGIDLRVDAGERVALLGPNGAGKTTTLLMLLGVITPDEGEIEIVGRRLPRERSAAMEQVGFAAGYLPLPERLRVEEFLILFGRLYGLHDPRPAAELGLARFGIAHLAKAMGNELSSGQRTLVGIIKATLHQPRLLVLDEPTASLDPDVARRVRTGLERLCADEGTALLVTSHNMQEVQRLCERVVFVSAGRVVADGTPEAVVSLFGRE